MAMISNELKILSSLVSGEKYGLEIIDEIQKAGVNLSLGSLYNTLNRLEKDGFVQSYWGDATADRGGNRRRYYRITALGASTAKEELTSIFKLGNWSLAYSY